MTPRSFSFMLGAVLLVFLGACSYSNKYQDVNVGNQFTLSVPSWTKDMDNELKNGAPFQYANRYRNFYAIGEIISKDTMKQTYNELLVTYLNSLRLALKNPVLSDSTAVTIGGLNGTRAEVFGQMGDENEYIYYSEVLLEGKNKIYHLSLWTRGANRKLLYKEDINKIIESFKESK